MKVNTTIGIQIIPISDMSHSERYQIIDNIINFIKQHKDVNVVVGPLETTIEGNYNDCMNVLYKAIKVASNNQHTIFANLKVIYNPNKILTIKEKTQKFQ